MITLPDFKEKKLIFVPGSDFNNNRLCIKNGNITLVRDGKVINQISCFKVLSLMIFGECSLSSGIIKECKKNGISLFLLNDRFRNIAEILSVTEGNYFLRMKQYKLSRQDELDIAKHFIKNKIKNQQYLLKRAKAKFGNDRINKLGLKVESVKNSQELLGIEGSASKIFFPLFFSNLNWWKRSPRTRCDIWNLLLDLGYSMLFNFVDAQVALFGFDPYKGFYHKLFFKRKSLVCDIVEPLRCLIDKQLLKSFNLNQINKKDFRFSKGRYFLPYDKQKKYLKFFSEALMKHKQEVFVFIRDYYYCIINEKKEYPE